MFNLNKIINLIVYKHFDKKCTYCGKLIKKENIQIAYWKPETNEKYKFDLLLLILGLFSGNTNKRYLYCGRCQKYVNNCNFDNVIGFIRNNF